MTITTSEAKTSEIRAGIWARTSNMALAANTMAAAINAAEGVPRMVLFYGPSGWGKTVVCSHVAAVTDAAYLKASSVWTGKTFLEKLAQEVGVIHLKKTASGIMDQIIEAVSKRPCPIIIDEMDHLVKKQSVELIRDIYDATDMPIMMVGEEALPAKLKEWERFDNRILEATPAEPASIADGRLLRDLYGRKVKLADDLVDHFTNQCDGVTRRIVSNLQRAQQVAIDELGVVELDLSLWGNRHVMNGDLPGRRK
jgi:SpoVK/Ycf46/Vps4 family AAA+-type ATPase